MSHQERYHISKNYAESTKSLLFPTRYDGGCYLSFRRAWLNSFPWLVYSGTADRELFEVSYVFAKSRKNSGALVNKPVVKWHRKSDILVHSLENSIILMHGMLLWTL